MKEEGEEDREEKRTFEECTRVGTVVNFVVVVYHFSSGDICREGREV